MKPIVSIIMGSTSDLPVMEKAAKFFDEMEIPFEINALSAHRTPELMFEYARTAESRGIEVIIAGAGGAAHLPGMTATQTMLPVIGVPVQSKALNGMDSLLSIVQMPGGVPVATMAIGTAGAKNAALMAARMLGAKHPQIREAARSHFERQREAVLGDALPDQDLLR